MTKKTNFTFLKPCFLSSLKITKFLSKKVKGKKIYNHIKGYVVQRSSIFNNSKRMGTVTEIVIDRSSHFIQSANYTDAKKLSKIEYK